MCMILWTKTRLDMFLSEALLTKDEEDILRMRIKGLSRIEISLKKQMSVATIDKYIANIKTKYDEVQKYNSDILPKRK